MRPLFDRRAGRARTALAERTGACLATLRVFARDWDTAFAETAEGVLFDVFRSGSQVGAVRPCLPKARARRV
ncbi:hypothetical protein BV392_01220 [Rhodovulum sulfidophilum]|nr:hypothetical protein BV392_01220 [Rhodovulum sulfidophilum]